MPILYEHPSLRATLRSFFPDIDAAHHAAIIGWSARDYLALHPQYCALSLPHVPYLRFPCSYADVYRFLQHLPLIQSDDVFAKISYPYWQLTTSFYLIGNDQLSVIRLQRLAGYCEREWPGWYEVLFERLARAVVDMDSTQEIASIQRIVTSRDGRFAARVDYITAFSSLFHSARYDAVNRWFGPLRTMVDGYAPDEPGGYRLVDVAALLQRGDRWWEILPVMLDAVCESLVARGIAAILPGEYTRAQTMTQQAHLLSEIVAGWHAGIPEPIFRRQRSTALQQIDDLIGALQRIERHATTLRKRLADIDAEAVAD